jgi:hypothetical protein
MTEYTFICAIPSTKKKTARTPSPTDHHSGEKYDQASAKITLTAIHIKPTDLKAELEGIFSLIIVITPFKMKINSIVITQIQFL